jgi:putative FmdB family regulatory protein
MTGGAGKLDFDGAAGYSYASREIEQMPIYEYQCRECERRIELLQQGASVAEPRCEECGGAMKRLISASAFILKGEGWYVTDYPSKDRKAGLEADKKARGKKKPRDKTKPKAPEASKKARKTRPPRKT